MNTPQNTYNPNYALHPGVYLEEILETRELKQREVAEIMGVTETYLSKLIHGDKPVGPDTALKLERVLGVSSQIWNNLNANFKLFEARTKELENLSRNVEWVKEFPLVWLKKNNFIPDLKIVEELIEPILDFFGVSSPEIWESFYNKERALYRNSKSFISQFKANATWLRASVVKANELETNPFNAEIFKTNLLKIRDMTQLDSEYFEPEMKKLCSESGVALVFMPEPPKVHVYGATKWLTPNKAMISLSLRRKSDDQFWFSFFHEAAHILLHGKKETFIDDKDMSETKKEDEADTFAKNILIGKKEYMEFIESNSFYENHILDFAKSINVSPGVIVGRLQHEGLIKYSFHNKLKRKFELTI